MTITNKILAIIFLMFCCHFSYALDLTKEEKDWLQDHPMIRIAYDYKMPPFEWRNEQGEYQGISIDIIKLIEKNLNVQFTLVDTQNWTDLLEHFKQQEIDMIPTIVKNENRQQFMNFTESYNSTHGVIISGKQYDGVMDLKGKKIAVVSDYVWDDFISKYDDEVKIVRVETSIDGIELVALGSIDAMITDIASISYYVNKLGVSNLHVLPLDDELENKVTLDFSMGVRKDWPQLKMIIEKALKEISQEDKNRIYKKWVSLQKISFWQSRNFWLVTSVLGIGILFIIGLIVIWNRSLKLQVEQRSQQLKSAHEQLMHAEKMESIGRLSAGIAHEVKNPLAILQMSVDYLKGEDNDETISVILNDMDDAIVRADTVIKGLLDFSREKELQVKLDSINSVIQSSFRLIEHETKQHNINVSFNLAEDLPELAMDKNRLQQVFINLFMNAVQAIDGVGEIYVQSKLSTITEVWLIEKSEGQFHLNQKVIDLQFLDTGSGLEKKNEKNVFEPFFTTKPVGEGTGLGLSVSKKIISLHNGMITMRNRTDECVPSGVEIRLLFAI